MTLECVAGLTMRCENSRGVKVCGYSLLYGVATARHTISCSHFGIAATIGQQSILFALSRTHLHSLNFSFLFLIMENFHIDKVSYAACTA